MGISHFFHVYLHPKFGFFDHLVGYGKGIKLTRCELSIRLNQEVLAVNMSRYLEAIDYYHKIPMLFILVVNEKMKFLGVWFKRLYHQFYKNPGVNIEVLYKDRKRLLGSRFFYNSHQNTRDFSREMNGDRCFHKEFNHWY